MTAANGAKGVNLRPATMLRVGEVADWLIEGRSRREILQATAEQWNLSERQTERLLQAARQQIIDAWQLERPEMIATLLSRADEVYRKAMAAGAYNAAVGAIAQQARLAKLG
jgi:hypothetical protein